MKFDKLHDMIPYAKGGKLHSLTMQPYNAITLAMPGRHQSDTAPVGGDFVVMVDDENMDWIKHQFTHIDLFKDLQCRTLADPDEAGFVIRRYLDIVADGDDPENMSLGESTAIEGCVHPKTFFYAVQCLAVAEHRRYAKYEAKFGGRYLPFRFAAGIVEGLWTATDAAERQKKGRPGVEWLEKDYGIPTLTKELMNND